MAGISPDTALGRIVAVRAETDKEVIKQFTPDQQRIYDGWRERRSENMTERQFQQGMAEIEATLVRMIGGT